MLLDAYDSFIYIVGQYLSVLDIEVDVVRVDRTDVGRLVAAAPDLIVLGPGPGHPARSGYLPLILAPALIRTPMLGICLGHQAIGLAFGGTVRRAPALRHGKTSVLEHDGSGCFAGMPPRLVATRYHSLVVDTAAPPPGLVVTARSVDDGQIMGLRHDLRPVESVQFHPESIASQHGLDVLSNFVRAHVPHSET